MIATPILALTWLLADRRRAVLLRSGWGLNLGQGFFVEIALGLAACGLLWGVGRVTQEVAGGYDSVGPFGALQPGVVRSLFAITWLPLVEEAMYRGALYRDARSTAGPLGATMVTSVVFVAVHVPPDVATLLHLMLFSCLLCLLREWRNSLVAPIAMHASFNTLVWLCW